MISERLKEFATTSGISGYRLAIDSGVPQATIAKYMTGVNQPSGEVLTKIIKAYPQLNARWLLTGEGDMLNAPGPEPKAE